MRGFRSVAEPLGTSTWGPKPPYVAQLGPCVPQLGPSRPIFGPTRRPRCLPGHFWSVFGPLRHALEAQKHYKIQTFCCISRSATDIVQIVQISPLEGQKRPAKSVPRAPPEPPKDGFRAALAAKLGPTGAKEPPGGHFGPPRGPVLHPPGVDFRTVLFSRKALPKLSSGQSLRKPTPSTALPPCVTSTCGLVRRRTADQGVLIHV